MVLVEQCSLSLIFPAYNEEGNILQVVEQAMQCVKPLFSEWEIIIVNDGSYDRTGEIIERIAADHSCVKPLHHHYNRGYGAALKTGLQQARGELVFFCDADRQFHLSELAKLVTWIEHYDIVIGYRAKRQDPWHRRLNARGWNMLVRLLFGLQVRDINCAFKLFRRIVFQAIDIDAVGAMVNTDILVQAQRRGFTIKEVPVSHFPRLRGTQSGGNIRVILKAFGELIWLYHKLRTVHPLGVEGERRRRCT